MTARQAHRVTKPAFAFYVPAKNTVHAWRPLATPKRLAHEYGHYLGLGHGPWWTFDVMSYNPIRIKDRHSVMEKSRAWRLAQS